MVVQAQRERHRFYYDLEEPAVLHITRQHGTTPREAVETFFQGGASTWDDTRLRFETFTDTHGLYWTRHTHDRSVIVISCFKRGDD